jgi:hypothetical protein
MDRNNPSLKEKEKPQGGNSLEFKRGFADGKRAYPCQEEEGSYYEGYREGYKEYMSGILRRGHRTECPNCGFKL